MCETKEKTANCEILNIGDFELQSGATIRDCKLAYKVHGSLNKKRDNAIVVPTFYGGNHDDIDPMIGENKALDPNKYFIVVPNMFGNGMSSSPSNTSGPYGRARFPNVTIYDNVVAQHYLLTEILRVRKIELVTGTSMGALQTYQWASLYPGLVKKAAPVCGSARVSNHNFVFLEGVKAALTADDAFKCGWYDRQPNKGLRAFGRVYAGWAVSQAFYRNEMYKKIGYSSLEDYLIYFWEGRRIHSDANDLLAMLWTWQHADISNNEKYNGDFDAALAEISAKTIVMPCLTDLYFPPEDSEYEVSRMPNAEFRPIESIWGHLAGSPGANTEDSDFIDGSLRHLLGCGE